MLIKAAAETQKETLQQGKTKCAGQQKGTEKKIDEVVHVEASS